MSLHPTPPVRPAVNIQSTTPPTKRTWRGETPEARVHKRQEQLMEAALTTFARHGIAKTTMRDICTEARLTERYFYEAFKSTDDAFDCVYTALKQQLVQRVAHALTDATPGVVSLGKAGLRAFYLFIKEDPRRAQIMLIDAFSANQHSAEKSRRTIGEYVDMIRTMTSTLYPEVPKTADLDMLASGLLGLAVQVGTVWARDGYKQSIDTVLSFNLYAWHGLEGWMAATRRKAAAAR
jgi:AcrR family transcriptional regulator